MLRPDHVEAYQQIDYSQCQLDPVIANLATKHISVDNILQAAAQPRQCLSTSNPSVHNPLPTRLVYVTPWNKDGYAYTTLHSEKLTFVSPVWYQVQLSGSTAKLEGSHDVDTDWMQTLSPVTQIVPRFEIKFRSKKEIEAILFFPQKEAENIVKTIVDEVKAREYAGATLEVPYTAQMTPLIRKLGTALHKLQKRLVLVIPAHHNMADVTPFGRRDLLDVQDFVDYFSLNAYDHAGALGTDSANAPIGWTRQILDELLSPSPSDLLDNDDPFDDDDIFERTEQRKASSPVISTLNQKVLLGINFYGFTFTKDGVHNSITAKEYTSLVQFSKLGIPVTVDWDEEQGEHRMDGTIWSIWYPTILSILHRLSWAEEYGVGISVWEGGQGLEYFWDIL